MKRDTRTLEEKLREGGKHLLRLHSAHRHLANRFPLRLETYENLDDQEASFVNQLTFRFSKLQETMGEKLFPLFLLLTGVPVKTMTFIDRINRLEELGLVDREEWFYFRQEHNEITHEYSFNQASIVEALNRIYEATPRLAELYEGFRCLCTERFGLDGESV